MPPPCPALPRPPFLDTAFVPAQRRTGRFTSPDLRTNFTAAEQVFNGTADYQVYMVLPFRLPTFRRGYYLATASFLLLNQTVRTELLQTTDHGVTWEQVSPGTEFIPLGREPGAFDSFTTYTAWSGTSAPLLDPQNASRTLFYYAGGDGPHDGQRDDSLGRAWTTTYGYAGLRAAAANAANAAAAAAADDDDHDDDDDAGPGSSSSTTTPTRRRLQSGVDLPQRRRPASGGDSERTDHGNGDDEAATTLHWKVLASLSGSSASLHVGIVAPPPGAAAAAVNDLKPVALAADGVPRWIDLGAGTDTTQWELECVGEEGECIVFALESSYM